jgi:hypothetical protein
MLPSTDIIRIICCGIVVCAAASAAKPASSPVAEHFMRAPIRPAADDSVFASKEDAEAYLTKTIPLATAANPKYRGAEPGVLTQWLTRTVEFGPSSKPNGISVSTSETYLEFRNGAQTATATHDVRFAIEDVRISERTDDPTLTENGEKALGVIFNCQSGKCIATIWNGAASKVDWSDISVQDATLRANILKAFQVLKKATDARS